MSSPTNNNFSPLTRSTTNMLPATAQQLTPAEERRQLLGQIATDSLSLTATTLQELTDLQANDRTRQAAQVSGIAAGIATIEEQHRNIEGMVAEAGLVYQRAVAELKKNAKTRLLTILIAFASGLIAICAKNTTLKKCGIGVFSASMTSLLIKTIQEIFKK